MQALKAAIAQLEPDSSLCEPSHFRQRSEALDGFDRFLADMQKPTPATAAAPAALLRRARMLQARLEAVNLDLYSAIRTEIRQGLCPPPALQSILARHNAESALVPAPRAESYDHLDELLTGVLQLEQPGAASRLLQPEMVPYQPTPARHIFHFIDRAALTAGDTLIDLGSGLGHVPLLVSICTPARCIGIEIDPHLAGPARRCAQSLNLSRCQFIEADARSADLSAGAIFFLYTPFTGSILRAVLDSLRRVASQRSIRIAAFGPCASAIAAEPWLAPAAAPQPAGVALFFSRV